jgi:poly-beta-1,6-N-acetyl-D-glucosamine synthase
VKLLFWLSAFLILYAYLLYPSWMFLRARLRPKPVSRKPFFPTISIVIAARNEEEHLQQKLLNLQQLDYPWELIEIAVVSDCSTDQTNDILRDSADPRLRSILLFSHCGKAEAINRAIRGITGEIVVFMDVRQRIAADSLKALVENFADPVVGCVSGELILGVVQDTSVRGLASYWRMEKSIRYWESLSGSVVGATGALYAVKRELIPRLFPGTVLDDVLIPMEVARRRARVILEPRAQAWDNLPPNPQKEFRRKVRTLYGNYQLLDIAPWLLSSTNPIRFEFVSHKLCRLAVPFALIGMIFSSFFLSGFFYRIPLASAISLLVLGALAFLPFPLGLLSRLTNLAWAFLLLNSAAVVAFFYFAAGKKEVWVH